MIQIAIASYIDQRLRPQVRVEDSEVRKVFNEKILNDAQAPAFSLVADGIRASLEKRSLDQKVEEWVASLRRRGEVRRVPLRPLLSHRHWSTGGNRRLPCRRAHFPE